MTTFFSQLYRDFTVAQPSTELELTSICTTDFLIYSGFSPSFSDFEDFIK